jgi:hypothetical protein
MMPLPKQSLGEVQDRFRVRPGNAGALPRRTTGAVGYQIISAKIC